MLSGHSGWSFWKASAMAERSASTQTVILAVGSCATVGKPYVLPVEEPADPVGPLVGVPEPAVPVGLLRGRIVRAARCYKCDAGCGCGHSHQPAGRTSLMQRHVVAPVQIRVDFFDHSRRQFEVNHTCDVLAIEAPKARPPRRLQQPRPAAGSLHHAIRRPPWPARQARGPAGAVHEARGRREARDRRGRVRTDRCLRAERIHVRADRPREDL